jgi:hypothetical protein
VTREICVINVMQTQGIYTYLFICVDAAASLLLKQEMVEAEFIRVEIKRIFTELGAVQDVATLRCSR